MLGKCEEENLYTVSEYKTNAASLWEQWNSAKSASELPYVKQSTAGILLRNKNWKETCTLMFM